MASRPRADRRAQTGLGCRLFLGLEARPLSRRAGAAAVLVLVAASLAFAGGSSDPTTAGAAGAATSGVKIYPTLADFEKQTGRKLAAFAEAPALTVEVKAGKLPEVAKRLPDEPMVLQPMERIGKYGGVFRTGAAGPEITGFDAESLRWENMVQVGPDLKTLVPNVVKSWQFSEDKKEITFLLRKGMKWSDGTPFTANDFVFWYEDVLMDKNVTPVRPRQWQPGGQPLTVTKVDDLTVKFAFAVTYPPVLSFLATQDRVPPYAPAHYLKAFHAKYNPKADEEAKKAGYDSWATRLGKVMDINAGYNDPKTPVLHAWMLKEVDSFGNKHYIRNPYYWKVDTQGNQLPYADGILKQMFENQEVIDLKIVSGELDISSRNLPVKNYSLYKNGEQAGGYRVIVGDGIRGSACSVQLNQTVKDPLKRKIFQNEKFKQAMSLAINRKEINDLLFFGRAVARQTTTLPSTSYYEPWMGEYFAKFDTAGAGKLLDEIGLDKKDKDGWRLGPDGKPFTILVETGPWEVYPKIAEMIAGYWSAVGVKTTAKTISAALAGEKIQANDFEAQLQGFANVTEFLVHGNPDRFTPPWIRNAYPWAVWINTKGQSGEEPPAEVKHLMDVVTKFQSSIPGSADYLKYGKEILEINVKGLYAIGTVGIEPMPVVVKNYVRNVPASGTIAWDYYFWTPYQASTFFIDK